MSDQKSTESFGVKIWNGFKYCITFIFFMILYKVCSFFGSEGMMVFWGIGIIAVIISTYKGKKTSKNKS